MMTSIKSFLETQFPYLYLLIFQVPGPGLPCLKLRAMSEDSSVVQMDAWK